MTPKIIHFNQASNPYQLVDNDELLRWFATSKSTKFKIDLLEMKVDNPSRFFIKLYGNQESIVIPLFKLRTKFLYQDGIYILDTSSLPYFSVDTSANDFEIAVTPNDHKFDITMYGFTDHTQRGPKYAET